MFQRALEQNVTETLSRRYGYSETKIKFLASETRWTGDGKKAEGTQKMKRERRRKVSGSEGKGLFINS